MPTLAHVLESRADGAPERVGLTLEDGRAWTFAQLDRMAGAAADDAFGRDLRPLDHHERRTPVAAGTATLLDHLVAARRAAALPGDPT